MPDSLARPELNPEFLAVQALLRDSGIVQADVLATPTVVARGHARTYQAFLNQDPPPLARIEEHVLAHLSPPLRVRLYYPDGATGPLPAYLHAHGGGFAIGDIDSLDRWKREVARDAGVVVVGLEYALAPEHKFPTARDQTAGAIGWLRDNAAALGIDAGRIGIGGDSAGGNLALTTLLQLRDAGDPPLRFGAIVYGMLSADHDSPSHHAFGDGSYGLSTAKLDWFWDQYLPDPALRTSAVAAPLTADLEGLPPLLLLTAGLDPLLDDTRNLDDRLTRAGVPHDLKVYPDVPHGFIAQTRLLGRAREARAVVVEALTRHLL
ncbi:acetyl esterase [Inquilinus ginsengisoli]|uniref:Acetyl esterase n=1 Tax=Inquilinus ginsengisoli TaxID=363840 RepID=A0ABU1JKG5_9PROT|nr:alpha/beta hydrolase [Inquilinus ginsengisoli]MDR6289105.1 acetyl esterase [Inquilinus ginsengisoli]